MAKRQKRAHHWNKSNMVSEWNAFENVNSKIHQPQKKQNFRHIHKYNKEKVSTEFRIMLSFVFIELARAIKCRNALSQIAWNQSNNDEYTS